MENALIKFRKVWSKHPWALIPFPQSHHSEHIGETETQVDISMETSKLWQNGEPVQGHPSIRDVTPTAKGEERRGGNQRGKVSWLRVMKLNMDEWWLIGLGTLGAAVQGATFPVFSIFFAEVLADYILPAEEVMDEINLWAGLSIMVGGVSAIATFIKVCKHLQSKI